jgi:hypothetical protein
LFIPTTDQQASFNYGNGRQISESAEPVQVTLHLQAFSLRHHLKGGKNAQ